MDFFSSVELASSAITIAEQTKKINGTLKKIKRFLTKGKCVIIIFGAGGTGKTTLSYILNKTNINDFKYNESYSIEKVKMESSEVWGHFLVAPGQERRSKMYWPKLFRTITSGNVAGVINVVSYGYHSADIGNKSYKSTVYYKQDREEYFLQNYLGLKRQDEIKYLKLIAEYIKTSPKDFWMITFVNKQDLWWDEKDNVREFYTQGEYNKIIEEIYSAKGTSNFAHEYLSSALFHCNFNIGNDFIKETVKGYDEPLRQSNFNKFLQLLNTLIHDKL